MNFRLIGKLKYISLLFFLIALVMVIYVFIVYGQRDSLLTNVYGTDILLVDSVSEVDTDLLDKSTGFIETEEDDIIQLYQKYKSINDDTVAYMRIRGSTMNFPIVQQHTICSTHNIVDNCYYLYRDIYKKTAVNTSAIQFMDANNDVFEKISDFDQNTVIYGHTWSNSEKNGRLARIGDESDKQFGQLVSYTDMDWLKSHSILEYTTGTERTYWIVQYVTYTDCMKSGNEDGFNYIKRTLSSDDIQKIYDRSVILNNSSVDVENDKFLLLSTCNYKYGTNKINRFIVLFKYIEADSYMEAYEKSQSVEFITHENVVDWT